MAILAATSPNFMIDPAPYCLEICSIAILIAPIFPDSGVIPFGFSVFLEGRGILKKENREQRTAFRK
jgi:hypothetical protein